MAKIKNLIGDYQTFFSDLLHRIKNVNIDISGMPISHLLYRTTTKPEYEKLRDELKSCCGEFVETQFNGRAVSILILKKPLLLEDGFTVSMIELPAPRPAHMYPSGLESIGVVVGKSLPNFIQQHKQVLTGVKEHGEHCQPAFITFENDKTSKFYDISLREIVILQGWDYAQQEVASKMGISRTEFIRKAVAHELKHFQEQLEEKAMVNSMKAMKESKSYQKEADDIIEGFSNDLPGDKNEW